MATMTAPEHAQDIRQFPETRRTNISRLNVGDTERLISIAAGGALAVYGLARRSLGGLALSLLGGALLRRGLSGHCDCFAALNINTADEHSPQASIPAGHGTRVEETITINRSPEELYLIWRDLEGLPRFMRHLESVRNAGSNLYHWVARGPLGARVEWDAEVITERPNELIGWRSVEGSVVDSAGSVHFAPASGGRGTVVRVVLKYDPPAGKLGSRVAWLFGRAPEQEIRSDLRRFKAVMETGEAPTIEGQPRGTCC